MTISLCLHPWRCDDPYSAYLSLAFLGGFHARDEIVSATCCGAVVVIIGRLRRFLRCWFARLEATMALFVIGRELATRVLLRGDRQVLDPFLSCQRKNQFRRGRVTLCVRMLGRRQ